MIVDLLLLSLNCEVCPGREGPIVFGEDNSCHVLSYTFNLRDSQARGFTRLLVPFYNHYMCICIMIIFVLNRYSFIVVMMDRVFLINSWPYLVRHFRALIDNLQAKVRTVYWKYSFSHCSIINSPKIVNIIILYCCKY